MADFVGVGVTSVVVVYGKKHSTVSRPVGIPRSLGTRFRTRVPGLRISLSGAEGLLAVEDSLNDAVRDEPTLI